jgi:hypothetical protein
MTGDGKIIKWDIGWGRGGISCIEVFQDLLRFVSGRGK